MENQEPPPQKPHKSIVMDDREIPVIPVEFYLRKLVLELKRMGIGSFDRIIRGIDLEETETGWKLVWVNDLTAENTVQL